MSGGFHFFRKRRYRVAIACLLVVCALVIIDRNTSRFTIRARLVDQNGSPLANTWLDFEAHELRWILPVYGAGYRSEVSLSAKTDADGYFSVGSPREHLELRGIERNGFVLEQFDRLAWHASEKHNDCSVIRAYDMRGPSPSLISRNDALEVMIPRNGEPVFVNLVRGEAHHEPVSADLKLSLSREDELSIYAMQGGVWLGNEDMPFAPTDDYLDGFEYTIRTSDHDPQFLMYLASQNGQHFGRVEIVIQDWLSGDMAAAHIRYRLNEKSSRDLRGDPPLKDNSTWTVTDGIEIGTSPWWAQCSRVVPIFTLEQSRELYSHAPDFSVVRALAKNPHTAPDVLSEIAKQSSDEYSKRLLAKNPATPKDVLMMFSRDKDLLIREDLATNSALPPEIVELLQHDPQPQVRANLAARPQSSN